MARTKQPKLAGIIDNKNLGNDLVIQIGEHSLTVGELRAMDAETDGASTKELETREGNLVRAQAHLAETLQTVAEKTGIPLEKLLTGEIEGVTPAGGGGGRGGDDDLEAALSDIDPKVLKALEKKFGAGSVATEVANMKKELADTKKALGIALKINMDDYYAQQWKELSTDIPKGDDGKPLVNLDLSAALKYADDNGLKDRTGRYNLQKAFNDMTIEARHQRELKAAEERGKKLGQDLTVAASVQKPGGIHPAAAKPPVDDKGRVKSLDAVMQDALGDVEIQRMIAGVPQVGAA
jgi:hypothetical protein